MLFPLILASALHGSWRVVLAVLVAVLFCYALAMLPALLERGTGQEIASLIFYRLAAVGLTGLFLMYLASSVLPAGLAEDYAKDEDGSILLERVEEELAARRGAPVAVILVDPGVEMEAMDLLLERVWTRIGEPVLLGEGNLFGVVVSGVGDGGVESAARRVLAAASSLGAPLKALDAPRQDVAGGEPARLLRGEQDVARAHGDRDAPAHGRGAERHL